MTMRITELVFLFVITEVLAGGGGGKHHVHFKIHVPDIIKHHIHTKTVFIHVHAGGHHGGGGKKKVVPKKKETHHEESHHEDWSSWSSYDVHGDHGNGKEHKQHGTKNVKTSGGGGGSGGHPAHLTFGSHSHGYGPHGQGYSVHEQEYDPRARPHGMLLYPVGEQQIRVQDTHSDFIGGGGHPVPPEEGSPNGQYHGGPQYQDGGMVGYSYPPQYNDVKAVTEAVHNDIEPYNDVFEEGYRKGHHSVTGHLLSENLKNFYDNKFEEGDASDNGYNEDSYEKYKDFESLKNEQDSSDVNDEEYNRRGGRSYLLPYRRVG